MMTAPVDPDTLTLASSSDWRTVKPKFTGSPAVSVLVQVSLGEVDPASQCTAVPSWAVMASLMSLPSAW